MDNINIKEIIEKHQHYLRQDCDGWEDMRADLCGANLFGADLRGTNLCGADLYGANLRGANLCEANLVGTNLREANLDKATLCRANLCGANLYGVDLCGANLCEANLCGANLCGANLYGTNLCKADLWEANLYEADLRGANNIPFIPYACPECGVFTGFKTAHNLIVVLEIPEDARRLSATGRKCRCDKAKVIDIQNIDGTKADVNSVSSDHDSEFIYEVGKEVYVSDFDPDRWNECSTGIHFFINRQEAVDYMR